MIGHFLQDFKTKRWTHASAARQDARHNRNVDVSEPHILVVRHQGEEANYNDPYLSWLSERFPAVAARFYLARLPAHNHPLQHVRLLVPWLQDPFRERFPVGYTFARLLEQRCRLRNIPVVNPVRSLSNSAKSRALPTIGKVGVRCARVIQIRSVPAFVKDMGGMKPPFFIREDFLHGTPLHLVEAPEDLDGVEWNTIRNPIAVEFIDARSADGYYRKYRYIMFGDEGIRRHVVVAGHWCVQPDNRILTQESIAEELEFVGAPETSHDIFNRARKALGLDVVAFDYSYDRQGQLLVWEPNPLATFWGSFNVTDDYAYQLPLRDRLYTGLTNYYLSRAGLTDSALQETTSVRL